MAMADCIIPERKTDRNGYVLMKHNGRYQPMHRVAYSILNGKIPAGLVIDHMCHNADKDCKGGSNCKHRMCINPAHLQAVTHLENVRLGRKPMENNSHCKHGHDLSENLDIRGDGRPYCKECRKRDNAQSVERKKARDAKWH